MVWLVTFYSTHEAKRDLGIRQRQNKNNTIILFRGEDWETAQWQEHLHCKHKDLSSNSNIHVDIGAWVNKPMCL